MALNQLGLGLIFTAKDLASPTMRRMRGGLDSLSGTSEAAAAKMTTAFKTIGVGAGIAAAGFVGLAILNRTTVAAEEFGTAIAEVSTLVDEATFSTAEMEKITRGLALQFGGKAPVQAKALYQIISAGASNAEEATALLTQSNKLALGGVTDLTTAADGLTTAMNVYAAQGLTAEEASDALFVAMKGGKALDLDTEIPTPDRGFVKLRDAKDGDKVFNENGEIETVFRAHDVINDAESFKITFSDGTVILACADHNWLTYTDEDRRTRNNAKRAEEYECKSDRKRRGHKTPSPTVKTTRQLTEDFIPRNPKLFKYRHYIQLPGPVEFEERQFSIDPYILGLWLGDGAANSARFSTEDRELLDAFRDAGYLVNKVPGDNCDYGIRCDVSGKRLNEGSLHRQLRLAGLLGNKHTPETYHVGSKAQRLALLQGLMDTDGYIAEDGGCEFSSTTKNLADGVKRLVDSLGMRAKISIKEPRFPNHKRAYRVYFIPTKFNPFRLPRKRARVKDSYRENPFLAIVSIEPINSRPMRCLTVTGDNSLFLVGHNFIVTHNTTIGELSEAMGRVLPTAGALGISFDEMLAAISAVTLGGLKTREAVTGLKAALAGVQKPTADARKEAARLGIQFDAATLRAKGLNKFMLDVMETSGFTEDSFTKLFGSIEGLNAITALATSGGAKFNEIMGAMGQKTGATDAAVEKMSGTMEFARNRFAAARAEVVLTIGKAIEPFKTAILDAGSRIFEVFTALPEPVKKFGVILLGLASASAVVVGGIIAIKGAIVALSVIGITALAPFLLLAGKILLVIGALVAVAFVLKAAWESNFLGIRNVVAGFVEGLKSLWGFIVDLLKPAWDEFIGALTAAKDRIVGVLEMFGLLGATTKTSGGALQGFSKILVGIFTFGIRIAGFFVRVWLWVQTRIIKILGPIIETFATLVGVVAEIGGAIGRFLGLGGGEPAPAPIVVGGFQDRPAPEAPRAPGAGPLSAAGALRELAAITPPPEAPAPGRAGAQEFHTHVNIDGERVVNAVDRRRDDDSLRRGNLKPLFVR